MQKITVKFRFDTHIAYEGLTSLTSVVISFLVWFAAFPRAAICISELACFFRFLFRLVKAAAANRGAPVPNVQPWGISGRAHLSSFYCLQTTLHFLRQQNSLFSSNFPENQILTFWHMMFKLLTCDQTRRMLSHNLLFCFIWHMFWDWANRLQMFTLFYIPAGSSVHPKSVFSHNSFCCWQHFFVVNNGVGRVSRHSPQEVL